MKEKVAAGALFVLGLIQMVGDLSGVPALKGIGAATVASPAPKVFSAVRGFETYSTRFYLDWRDPAGRPQSIEITSERYAQLRGPYNRRNVYGAALAYGPVMPAAMREPVMRYALCGDRPLVRELGIDPSSVAGPVTVRFEPRPGTQMGELPPRFGGHLPMKNRWTGGQYSVFRVLFGSYLGVHFAGLLPWGAEVFSNRGALPAAASPVLRLFPNVFLLNDSPAAVTAVLWVGLLSAALFALGLFDRAAAVVAWYVWACLFGRDPLISNPGLPYVGWILLAHAFLPRAPYGSWARRKEIDPGAGWRMPPWIFAAAWALMALGYSYSGYTKLISPSWIEGTALRYVLQSPLARANGLRDALLHLPLWAFKPLSYAALGLELFFAPLALVRRARPVLWCALLGLHLSLIAVVAFADLSLGMVMLHLFTFDPGWVKPLRGATPEELFYDGHCGLCHRTVRFLLSEDLDAHFRYAPLQGERIKTALSEEVRRSLPDSLVVLTSDGRVLYRSAGVLYLMAAMGGLWRVGAAVVSRVPARALDRLYDGVAAIRYRLFPRPAEACPILPKELRARFDG